MKGISNALVKSVSIVGIGILLLGDTSSFAQTAPDSVHNPFLASNHKSALPHYIVRQANVVFPEILKGNEEEAMAYIEKFSVNRRDYIIRMFSKGKTFLPKATAILKKYQLPEELKVLLPLESAYNGNAVSKAGAVGYWQIMDEVAKEYGMQYVTHLTAAEKKKLAKLQAAKKQKGKKVMVKKDDRMNFSVATHTAARYLRDRRRNLEDNWLLVVASYNCGVGNVWNAMARSGKENPTFWDIKNLLPAETRAYVLNFITLNVIFNNYEAFINKQLTFREEKILLPANLNDLLLEVPSDYIEK